LSGQPLDRASSWRPIGHSIDALGGCARADRPGGEQRVACKPARPVCLGGGVRSEVPRACFFEVLVFVARPFRIHNCRRPKLRIDVCRSATRNLHPSARIRRMSPSKRAYPTPVALAAAPAGTRAAPRSKRAAQSDRDRRQGSLSVGWPERGTCRRSNSRMSIFRVCRNDRRQP
jgi:hypothetical protein